MTPRVSLTLLAIVVVTAVVFAPVRHFEFVNYDDPDYVTENALVRQGVTWAGVRWVFTSVHQATWHPVTGLSHLLDCEMFGLDAGAHHLTSLLLHLLNVVLVFALGTMATGAPWASLFVAAVFALHPLHVESVAWISERKDVLSTFFALLTMIAYVVYAQRGSRRAYCGGMVAFVAALLAKPMVVTLPGLLLLMDWWPLRRRRLRGLEKVPFVVLAGAVGLVAIAAQRRAGAMAGLDARPISARAANAVMSYARYLAAAVWPTRLAFFYPYREWEWWRVLAATVLFIGVSLLAFATRRRAPYVAFGWIWFVVTLLPVIGLAQVGDQAMADRYMYLALVGPALSIAGVGADWCMGRPRRVAFAAFGAIMMCGALALATARQVLVWHDSEALLTHALAVTEGNYVAHDNLGTLRLRQGRHDEALAQFQASLTDNPNNPRLHVSLGAVAAQQGKLADAVEHYRDALRLKANYPLAQVALANLFMLRAEYREAVPLYRAAIAAGFALARTRNNLGVGLANLGDVSGALREYLAAVAVDPNYVEGHENAAIALTELGRPAEAAEHTAAAARLRGAQGPRPTP